MYKNMCTSIKLSRIKKKKENLRRIRKVFVFVLLEQEFNEPRLLQFYRSFYFF